MTGPLVVALLTLGDPGRLTGGYLYHVRMAEMAPAHGARLEFVSFPEHPFPLAALDAPAALRRARRPGAPAPVLDSIVAAAAAPGPPPGDLRRGRRAAFLCVANWVERKGLRDLLDAFARLPPDAATLHLAGDDRADPRYAARLRARLARADLAGRVVVHGPLPREAVAALYEAADA